jgi:hypothetical protein
MKKRGEAHTTLIFLCLLLDDREGEEDDGIVNFYGWTNEKPIRKW